MPTDNSIYEGLTDWWDPTGSVAGIHAMNPARVGYFLAVIAGPLARSVRGLRILDVGTGGGLLAEQMARSGARVTGIDRAHGALRVALAHARASGHEPPAYLRADARALPCGDGVFDVVTACDFLEHIRDGARREALRECARALAPGGAFLFDTINRTWLTRLFHIGVLQEWRELVPADTHDFDDLVRPEELAFDLREAGLEPVEIRGLNPRSPLRFALHLIARRRGDGPMPPFKVGGHTLGSYVGWARRR